MIKTVGVIGLGSIGLRHKNNLWQHLKQTEVIGYDPDAAKQNGSGWIIGDLDKMIEMSDALVIASPTDLHLEHITKCVLANKHIICEKPIAATMGDGARSLQNAIATCKRGSNLYPSRVFMVGYNLRFHSCVKKAKAWVQDKFIGQPLWANFTLGQFSEKPPYLRDGVILNWSHEIDLALHLLGPAEVAASSTRLTDGKDDISDILLTHDNGCRSIVHLDYVTTPEIRQSIIVGTDGTIIFDLVHSMAWLRSKDDIILDQHQGSTDWNLTYIEEMQAFLDRCDGKKAIGCTADEALDVLKICLEVRKQAGL